MSLNIKQVPYSLIYCGCTQNEGRKTISVFPHFLFNSLNSGA